MKIKTILNDKYTTWIILLPSWLIIGFILMSEDTWLLIFLGVILIILTCIVFLKLWYEKDEN